MENKDLIQWYLPKGIARRLNLTPDQVAFTKTRITLCQEIGEALGGGKVAIGLSTKKGAVFFRAEKEGYVMRQEGKHWVINAGSAQFAPKLQQLLTVPCVLTAVRHSDGSYGCYC